VECIICEVSLLLVNRVQSAAKIRELKNDIMRNFKGILTILFFLFSVSFVQATTYYTYTNGNPSTTFLWWRNTNGTGTPHPSNFITAGDIFIIQHNNTMTATGTWTVGAGGTTASTLQINSGCTLAMSTYLLTLASCNFTNSGTYSGSGGVTISGTLAANSIAGFKPTGLVSIIKTAGTATFTGNVNGAGLTINGSGGTLDLGTSLTHTFTGDITLNAGTLNGGSSTLNENNVSATAWDGTGSNFNAGTGTVNFGGAGDQTISASSTTFNILTFSNSGTKTLNSATVANGTLTINSGVTLVTGNNTLTFGGDFVNSGGTFTAGNSPMIITGTATQSIAGFTTKGLLSMTKTTGTATFMVLVLQLTVQLEN